MVLNYILVGCPWIKREPRGSRHWQLFPYSLAAPFAAIVQLLLYGVVQFYREDGFFVFLARLDISFPKAGCWKTYISLRASSPFGGYREKLTSLAQIGELARWLENIFIMWWSHGESSGKNTACNDYFRSCRWPLPEPSIVISKHVLFIPHSLEPSKQSPKRTGKM